MTHLLAVPNTVNWNYVVKNMGNLDNDPSPIEEVGMIISPQRTGKTVVLVRTNSDRLAHLLVKEYGSKEMVHN